MSTNAKLAASLELMSKLMDLTGADSFRSSAHARAARTIADSPLDLCTLAKTQGKKALIEMPGIGDKMADKIIEFAKSGVISELRELEAAVPPGLLEIMQIPGLGPKTVRVFWQDAGVTDLASLKKIIDDGSILKLPRMGEKAVAKMKESIALHAQSAGRLRIGPAKAVADRAIQHMRKVKGVTDVVFAGSLRRGKETIGDIDILVACETLADAGRVSEAFVKMPGVVQIIAQGDTRCSVLQQINFESRWDAPAEEADSAATSASSSSELASSAKDAGEAASTPKGKAGPTVQVDLRVLPKDSFGAALMYFTGSKEHNVALRQRALDRGWTLSDYGLFPDDKSEKEPPHKRGVKPIAAATEEEIFAALGLSWIPPELRENHGEIHAFEKDANSNVNGKAGEDASENVNVKQAKAPRGKAGTKGKAKTDSDTKHSAAAPTPHARSTFDASQLITLADIKAELHSHTTASDGDLSIIELASAAKARGFHTLAITDHSKSSAIANGLSPERLREHIAAIHAARKQVRGIQLFAGSEVDILSDGALDYDDDLLRALDVVVASPHAALGQDSSTATERLLKAIRHPLVHILGHPTGRLIMRRRGLEPDMNALFAAAKEHNVALEINAHWMRLDLRDTHVRAAVDAGCLIAIDCDVHHPDDFDNLQFGVMTGRRGWLPREQCINTWDAARLATWMKKKGRG